MPVNPGFNMADMIRFLPEIILTIAATLLMVLDPLLNKRASNAFGHISILALIGAIAALHLRVWRARPSLRRPADGRWIRHLFPHAGDGRRHI